MEPEFPDECVVVIEPSDWCQHGMYVMAMVRCTLVPPVKDDQGERLIALNDIYPPIPLGGLEKSVEGIVMQRNRAARPSGRREVKHYKYK